MFFVILIVFLVDDHHAIDGHINLREVAPVNERLVEFLPQQFEVVHHAPPVRQEASKPENIQADANVFELSIPGFLLVQADVTQS